ncbi:UNVERIFIED_CONTAM: putative mitochondrial protein [Sesamum radiatum]|uniref:Mitochondrial protein n=1 Tax=Sesamum radiatum TaxID=300843 RepID=A0AAW2TXS4_SESRA
MIQYEESQGILKGVAVSRNGPRISHLLFADDILLFVQATKEALLCIRGVLEKFEAISGLAINCKKSAAIFSKNVDQSTRIALVLVLGVSIVERHEKYLGLPTVIGRSKRAVFDHIKSRIWEKMQHWRSKLLSQAGRTVLLKAVIQAVPAYVMSVFRITNSLLRELESMMANFFWNHGQPRKIHWVAWRKVCRAKDEGGLGLRNLKAFNWAMLAKQLWRIVTRPDSLVSQLFKGKYFPDTDIFSAKVPPQASYAWRSLMEARNLIEAGLRWSVGSGASIRLTEDRWLLRPSFFRPTTSFVGWRNGAAVTGVMDAEGAGWDVDLVRALFSPHDADSILVVPVQGRNVDDILLWHYGSGQVYGEKCVSTGIIT